MKKIITLFALLVAITTISMTTKKTKVMEENVPIYHETLGEIPPIDVLQDIDEVVWSVDNNTGCPLTTRLYFTLSGIPTVISTSSTTVNANEIRSMFSSFIGPNDAFTITNVSARISIGSGFNFEIYPGMSPNPVTISTGLPAPCDCLHINFNRALQKIIITPGSGC